MQAYDDSQRLRRTGKLLDAKAALLTCSQTDCPGAVVTECTKWLSEVNASIPTVVLGARSWDGHDLRDIRVSVEGHTVAQQLTGQAVPLDPGPVTFVFTDAKGVEVKAQAVIREGEKNRAVVVDFPKPPPPPAGPSDPRTFSIPESGSVPAPAVTSPASSAQPEQAPPQPAGDSPTIGTVPIVLAAVGAVGLGSFVFFGLDAKSDVSDLRDRCAPRCTDDEVSTARRKALIADISLGVSAVALGTAAVLVFGNPSGRDAAPSASVRVGPGSVLLTGSF